MYIDYRQPTTRWLLGAKTFTLKNTSTKLTVYFDTPYGYDDLDGFTIIIPSTLTSKGALLKFRNENNEWVSKYWLPSGSGKMYTFKWSWQTQMNVIVNDLTSS